MKALIRKMLLLTLTLFALCSVMQPARAEEEYKYTYHNTYVTVKAGTVYELDRNEDPNGRSEWSDSYTADFYFTVHKYKATADGYIVLTNYNYNNGGECVEILRSAAASKTIGDGYTYTSYYKTMRVPVAKGNIYYIRAHGWYKFKITQKTANIMDYNFSRPLAKPLERAKTEMVCEPDGYVYNRYYSFVPETTGIVKITIRDLLRDPDSYYNMEHRVGIEFITVLDKNGKQVQMRWAAGDVYKTKVKLKAGQTYYIRVNANNRFDDMGVLLNLSWTQ